jgi:hypothetical protein
MSLIGLALGPWPTVFENCLENASGVGALLQAVKRWIARRGYLRRCDGAKLGYRWKLGGSKNGE